MMVTHTMRELLANATEFLVSTLVDLMTRPVTIEPDCIWAVLSKVPTSVTAATCMCLSIMGKTSQELAKSRGMTELQHVYKRKNNDCR